MTTADSDDGTAERLIAAARRQLGGSGPAFLQPLAADLFARTPPEDFAVYGSGEVAAFVESAASLLATRQPGRHLIRIENPEIPGRDKRHLDVTLIETLTDNMPFLLDSIIGELEDFGCEIRLVAHPIVSVGRDRAGRLVDYRGLAVPANGAGEIRESLIQIHVARLAGDDSRAVLAGRLDRPALAISGAPSAAGRRSAPAWQAAIAAYRESPPPIEPGELSEAIAFLEWLLELTTSPFLGTVASTISSAMAAPAS